MLNRTVSRFSSKGSDDRNMTKLEQDFSLGESLGRGGFGQIIKAKRISDNNEFAIKIIKFDSNMEDLGMIRREANLLSKLSHNNIVRYYNSWIETAQLTNAEYEQFQSESEDSLSSEIRKLSLKGYMRSVVDDDDDDFDFESDDPYEDEEDDSDDDGDNSVTFQSEVKEIKFMFIQMELCDKRSLRLAIDENLYCEENRLTKYFKEICEGLSYIHENYIVHRDLKPENIFLTSNDVIKIGDFGLSKQISLDNEFEAMQKSDVPYGSLTATCGTSVYIAPELYNGNKFNVKADIYSLGVTYFEMCSRPMTEMEKITTFPVSLEKWKTINFPTNNSSKKILMKSLLHINHKERPTCSQILKILNSDKSIDEIKDAIQQTRRVSNQEWKTYERTLKCNDLRKTQAINDFLTRAVKVFERHGGQNIPMPTFLPSFSHLSDNLTTLVSSSGNFSSVSNTSRIPFACYVASNKIKKMRRYSVGRVFEEGHHSPSEIQECLFEVVSPEPNDYVTDAEMLYITHTIFDEIKQNLLVIVNHGLIFSTILAHCQVPKKEMFQNILSNSDMTVNFKQLFNLEVDQQVAKFMATMSELFVLENAEVTILQLIANNINNEAFAKINTEPITRAFRELKAVVNRAKEFGVGVETVVQPLFINQKYSKGFMFKVVYHNQVLATGGRFDSLINACNRIKKKKRLDISAVDVSFNVENISKIPTLLRPKKDVYIVIVATQKATAIPLYTHLLSMEIKCEIVKDLVSSAGFRLPSHVISPRDKTTCVVYQVEDDKIPWKLKQVYGGSWKTATFSNIVAGGESAVAPMEPLFSNRLLHLPDS